MGRKKLTCNLGDVFGCYKVLSLPEVEGEHSFVDVECIKCGSKSRLALSEIKNRPKINCKKCRGKFRIKYQVPNIGDIINNWKVVDNTVIYIKNFRMVLCECIKCGAQRYIRIIYLYETGAACYNCKTQRKIQKHETKVKKTNRKQNDPIQTKFNAVCREAAKRSILVTITPEYLQKLYDSQDHKCALTGDNLPNILKASLDRIDSKKPYEEGNLQFVTKEANLAKHIMSQEDFINFCRRVVNHANQQPSQPLTKLEGSETNS